MGRLPRKALSWPEGQEQYLASLAGCPWAFLAQRTRTAISPSKPACLADSSTNLFAMSRFVDFSDRRVGPFSSSGLTWERVPTKSFHFVRYLEEVIAETAGTKNLWTGLTVPFNGVYSLSPARVALEGAGYLGAVAGNAYTAYELSNRGNGAMFIHGLLRVLLRLAPPKVSRVAAARIAAEEFRGDGWERCNPAVVEQLRTWLAWADRDIKGSAWAWVDQQTGAIVRYGTPPR